MQLAKIYILVIALLIKSALACSSIFISNGAYHIAARSMDFGLNIAQQDRFAFINQHNTTDVVVDANKIPKKQLLSWTNRYGYWSRDVFNSAKAAEGVNSEGLTISALYLAGITAYPKYNPKDTRPVLGVFDTISYLLSQAKDVTQALQLLTKLQIVASAINIGNGVFIKDIPVHIVLLDKSGDQAVIEFIAAKLKVYHPAGTVLTNNPSYPEQLANLAKAWESSTHQYMVMGDFSSSARFVRASAELAQFPNPSSRAEALYQADFIINSVSAPHYMNLGDTHKSATIWRVIKDLDRQVIYLHDVGFYQNHHKFVPADFMATKIIDLHAIDFSIIPNEYQSFVISPSAESQIKQIVDANDVPGFGG